MLAPQLYLLPRPGDLTGSGALLAGAAVNLDSSGNFINSGSIAGRQVVNIAAATIENLGGNIRGDSVSLTAQNDLANLGGRIEAVDSLSLQAGRDLTIASTTRTQSTAQGSRTNLDRIAGLYVTGSSATLTAVAGRDLKVNAAAVLNAGNGATSLAAGNHLSLGALTESHRQNIVFDSRNHLNTARTEDSGSLIRTQGTLTLLAGNDLTATAADLQSAANTALIAGNDIALVAGARTLSTDEASVHQSKGQGLFGSTRTSSQAFQREQSAVIASTLSGENLSLQAGNDLSLEAAQLAARNQLALAAGRDLKVGTAEDFDVRSEQRQITKKENVGPGRQSLKTTRDETTVTPRVSQLSGQEISLQAGRDLTLVAPQLAATSLAASAGNQLTIAAATATHALKESSEFKSNRLNFSEITAPLRGKDGVMNASGHPDDQSFVTGGRIKDKIKLSQSESQRQAVVAEIDATSMALNSGGDTVLVAPRINAEQMSINAGTVNGETVNPAAQIQFLGVKESTSASSSKNSHSFMHETVRDGGSSQETLKLPDIRLPDAALANAAVDRPNSPISESLGTTTQGTSTQLALVAPGGLVVGATSLTPTQREQTQAGAAGGSAPAGTPLDLKTQAQTLSKQPGLAWLGELAQRKDVDWQQIELAQQNWDFKRSGLTQEGAVVVAIVVTVLSWGTASEAGAAIVQGAGASTAAGTAGAAVAAGLAAGMTTLASQAAVSLINNQGDVGKTLQDLGSQESVRQLVASMLTAGLAQGATSALQGAGILGKVTADASFATRFANYATKAVVAAGVQSAVYGTPLSETAKSALINALAQSLTSEIGDWGKSGSALVAKTLAHAVVQCAAASVQNKDCGSAALGAAVAEVISPLLDQLDDRTKAAGYQQSIGSSIAGMSAMLVASLTGKDAMTALNSAQMVDYFNRQLHPLETKWIKDNAKAFAQKEGVSEDEATKRLTQQALKEVDYLWRAQLSDGDDASAKAYLAANGQKFVNDLGEQQKLFTTQGQQLFRPEMFADAANPAFYKQFAQSGITRSLTSGLLKELKDSGIDIKNGAVDLAQAAKDNPGAAVSAVWQAVQGLPQSIVDSFKETGTAIGEGVAIALNDDIAAKLNAIYGTDVSGAQKALLAIRITTALTGAAGTAKATGKTAKALGKKFDDVLDQKALDALLKSGGVYANGEALLDLKQLTTAQKGVMGELFGPETVKQIIPDGQKLARAPMIGETGIDDLYKVSRPDVDFVKVEYKFVGTDSKTGAQVLGKTNDGLQGSDGWFLGGDRLSKAVGTDQARDVRAAIQTGRTETWVVTTRPDGSTELQVLDGLGKPKLTNTSKILTSGTNLSGAKP